MTDSRIRPAFREAKHADRRLVELLNRLQYYKSAGLKEGRKEITERMVSTYETGQSLPPFDIVALYAEHFDCSLAYMLGTSYVKGKFNSKAPRIEALQDENLSSVTRDTGISINTLKKYKAAESYSDFSVNHIMRLAAYYGVSVDHLLGLTEFEDWDSYAASCGNFAYLPGGSVFLVGRHDGEENEYMLLSSDRRSFVSSDGTMYPAMALRETHDCTLCISNTVNGRRQYEPLRKPAGKIAEIDIDKIRIKSIKERLMKDSELGYYGIIEKLIIATEGENYINKAEFTRLYESNYNAVMQFLEQLPDYDGYYHIEDIAWGIAGLK